MGSELNDTMAAIKKRYGDASIRLASNVYQPDRISTGVFTLDFALLGGIPHNRISMIVGERHAGKSMLANMIIANAQRQYPEQTPVLLDVEGTFESTWAEKLGVDLERLPTISCETGEMGVDVGDAIIQSAETSLLVVDSLAALVPMKEVESSAEDAHVGLQARLIGSFIRRLTSGLIKERKRGHYVTVLFLNQFRTKIGVTYGDPRTIPGGKALEFATSVQVIIKNKEKSGSTAEGIDTMLANEHAFTVTKNKLNNGPRTGEFVLVREPDEESGLLPGDVDDASTVLAFAKKFNLYTGSGQKWTLDFGDQSKYTFGKAKDAIQMLREDKEMYRGLRTHILRLQAAKLGMTDEFISRIG
jgi:recombination protein RecA